MSDLVVDASVAIMLLFSEPLTLKAAALFDDAQRVGDRLVAPYLLPVEVTNSIRRHMRQRRISLDDALGLLDDFLVLPIDLEAAQDLHRRVLRLTQAHSLGGHDAHYVALA